ncbi:MAG: SDR family oxidoreductase [Solirubrobacterales bacterium]|nr:SDR family oxidoreductase [Solirubrobacterales bacterium]
MSLPSPSPDATCLITGASSGIGTELAHALARRGHGLTLVARRQERLEELAGKLGDEFGVRVETVASDVGEPKARDSLARELEEKGLTVSVLCNNAGFGSGKPFITLDREREVEIIRVNCEAIIDLCGRYAPPMAERGEGAILNVASTAAFQPLPNQATYASSKAMVLSFSESLHQELKPKGVTVTALCPGPVKTEFAEVAGIAAADSTPSFIWASAEDVAESAVKGLDSGERVVIPGAINEVGAVVGRFTPRALFLRAAARFYPVGRD